MITKKQILKEVDPKHSKYIDIWFPKGQGYAVIMYDSLENENGDTKAYETVSCYGCSRIGSQSIESWMFDINKLIALIEGK